MLKQAHGHYRSANSVRILSALAGLAVAAAAAPALAQASFRTIAPDAGYDYAVVQDISRDGRFALVSLQNSTQRPTILKGYILNLATNARVEIEDPFGRDLNPIALSADGSVAVGYIGGGPLGSTVAIRFDGDGVFEIGGLPAGNLSYATGVSDDGNTVVGSSGANFGDAYQQAWKWTFADGIVAFDDLGPDTLIFGSAEDISGDGSTMVGFGSIGDQDPDTDDLASAVYWSSSDPTTPNNLGNLPSQITTGGATAYACSVDGSVIVGTSPGFAGNGGFAQRGFRWTSATGLQDIGSLASNPNGSLTILDCASDGNTLVGYMIDGGVSTWQAIVYTPSEGVQTLRSLLAAEGVTVASNLGLRETFTSGNATVLGGWAYNITTQRYVGYVATLPSPRCIADYNADGGIDGSDVEAFFIDWQDGLPAADVDNSGGVDGTDVEVFFVAWSNATC